MSPRAGRVACAALAGILVALAVANAVRAVAGGTALNAVIALALAVQAPLVWRARALYPDGPRGPGLSREG